MGKNDPTEVLDILGMQVLVLFYDFTSIRLTYYTILILHSACF